jgi:alkylation response protein AidB-like acyl-CoA dehydrogenase
VSYLKTRKQFGKLIGAFQGLKHPTAELFTHAEMARSLVYAAATHSEGPLGWRLTRMAKAKLGDLFVHAGDRAVQFHGGMGFTYECDAGLFLRRALWMRSQWGDGVHHRKALEAEVFAGLAA